MGDSTLSDDLRRLVMKHCDGWMPTKGGLCKLLRKSAALESRCEAAETERDQALAALHDLAVECVEGNMAGENAAEKAIHTGYRESAAFSDARITAQHAAWYRALRDRASYCRNAREWGFDVNNQRPGEFGDFADALIAAQKEEGRD